MSGSDNAVRSCGSQGLGGGKVAVIGSLKLGVIGVGVVFTEVFRHMLLHFCLYEAEFLRGATIKYGIRQRDWRPLRQSYKGPIDTPLIVAGGAVGW